MFGSKKSSEGAKPSETKEQKAARKLAEKEQKKREAEGTSPAWVLNLMSFVVFLNIDSLYHSLVCCSTVAAFNQVV